jgi:hypothetical protein
VTEIKVLQFYQYQQVIQYFASIDQNLCYPDIHQMLKKSKKDISMKKKYLVIILQYFEKRKTDRTTKFYTVLYFFR